MQALAKYRNEPIQREPEQGLSLKEKVGYFFLAVASATALGLLIKKGIKGAIATSSDKKSFQAGTPATIATQIGMAFQNKGRAGVSISDLREVMTNIRSQDELAKVRVEYRKQFGTDLNNDLKSKLQTSEYNEMLQIMEGKLEKPGETISAKQLQAWARRFKAAFDKTEWGMPATDEDAIRAIMVEIPTQRAFLLVAASYEKLYGKKLNDDLTKELLSYELKEVYDSYNRKPKA
jgi:hypothetical protein